MKPSLSQIFYISLMLLFGFQLQSSMAAVSGAQTFAVAAQIIPGCEFRGAIKPLQFSNITANSAANSIATSKIQFRCSVALMPKVVLSSGLHPNGTTPQLYSSEGQHSIPYRLSLGKDEVTHQADHTVTVTATLNQDNELLYPGHYFDTVTVTIIY